MRICFAEITSIYLSNLSDLLYIGGSNGNISRIKFTVDRDKGIGSERDQNILMVDKNYKNFSSTCAIEKIYKFVLSNSTVMSDDELPDKVCL